MIKVVKQEELLNWLKYKADMISSSDKWSQGYKDGMNNIIQDVTEGRIPTHLFTGEESESEIL